MIDLDNWKINNLVIELRFSPSPYFFKKKSELIENLYMDFPNYNIPNNEPTPVAMHTENNPGINLNMAPNRLVILFEKFDDDKILDKGKRVINFVLKTLQVQLIKRFGMRINMIKKMELKNANDILNSFINNKFTGLNLMNSSCILNFKNSQDENLRIALSRGITQNVQVGVNNGDIQQEPISGLSSDIDFSKENVEPNNVINLIDNGFREYEKCQLSIH